jgi:hypothetical protein
MLRILVRCVKTCQQIGAWMLQEKGCYVCWFDGLKWVVPLRGRVLESICKSNVRTWNAGFGKASNVRAQMLYAWKRPRYRSNYVDKMPERIAPVLCGSGMAILLPDSWLKSFVLRFIGCLLSPVRSLMETGFGAVQVLQTIYARFVGFHFSSNVEMSRFFAALVV